MNKPKTLEALKESYEAYQKIYLKELSQRSQIQDTLRNQITELFEGSYKENLLALLSNPLSFEVIVAAIEKKLNPIEQPVAQIPAEPAESTDASQTISVQPGTEPIAELDINEDSELSTSPQDLPIVEIEQEIPKLEHITLQKFKQNLFGYQFDIEEDYSQDQSQSESIEAKRQYLKPIKISSWHPDSLLPVEFSDENFSFSRFLLKHSSLKGIFITSNPKITDDTTLIFYPDFYNDIINTSRNMARQANKKSDSAIAAVILRSVTKDDLSMPISILKNSLQDSKEFKELFEIDYKRGSLNLTPTQTLVAMLTIPEPAPTETQTPQDPEQTMHSTIVDLVQIASDSTASDTKSLQTIDGLTSLDQLTPCDLKSLNKYKA